jgi:hypothetical protein
MMNKKFAKIAIFVALTATLSKTYAYNFGDDWTVNGVKKCNVLDLKTKKILKSLYPKHAGVDYIKPVGYKVIVTGDLYFHKTHTESSGWKDYVIACTTLGKDGKTCANTNTYYNFLHLNANTKLKTGQSLKNVQIGTIADLSGKKATSHLHYSKRIGAWNDSVSYKGALNPQACNDPKTTTYPLYQELFVDPTNDVLFKIQK